MIRRPPRSTRVRSSAASDVYKRQEGHKPTAERKAPRGLLGILRESRSVRWMTMGASVLALSEAAQLARADQAAANPNTFVRCSYSANYDPKVCNKTKQQAVDECKLYANLNQFDLIKSHDRYVKGCLLYTSDAADD